MGGEHMHNHVIYLDYVTSSFTSSCYITHHRFIFAEMVVVQHILRQRYGYMVGWRVSRNFDGYDGIEIPLQFLTF